ncbi:winged helix-turn-helix domain-containing protein, partial [Bacillus sp. D-CC]
SRAINSSGRKGFVVSSEQLFHEIWGDEYFSKSNNTITVHIRHLREKMNDTVDNPKYIKTVFISSKYFTNFKSITRHRIRI